MRNYNVYPFVAIVGQEDVKTALLLNLINPKIGGALLAGEKGTAKSTIVRGLGNLTDMPVVDIPLNITEDRLVGGIDFEAALREGKRELEDGLLSRVHGGIAYVDEVNLLPDHIINILLEVSSKGENIIEREGISFRHMSSFALIGSMNPEEGKLRPAFLDRFGLYVEVHAETDTDKRIEIMRRRLAYESAPSDFYKEGYEETKKLSHDIEKARFLLDKITVCDECLQFIAHLASAEQCAGHRAEIITLEAALAVAALEGAKELTEGHIRQAAKFTLPHRIRKSMDPYSEYDFTDNSSRTEDENTLSNNALKAQDNFIEPLTKTLALQTGDRSNGKT